MNYGAIIGGVAGAVVGGVVAVCTYGTGSAAVPACISAGMALGGSVGGAVDSKQQADETKRLQAEAAVQTMDRQKTAANKEARSRFNQAQRQNTGGQVFRATQLEDEKSRQYVDARDKAEPFQPKDKKSMYGNPQIMKAAS